ncbi:WD domain repeat-containing protein 55 [Entophlyctis luteolus]|nr:WD domain repeat-containing protein 55 [Entophlyctis luteolus]
MTATIPFASDVQDAAFHPREHRVVAAAEISGAVSCDPVNCIKALDNNMLATGDDGGTVKLWDTRDRKLVAKYTANEDFISDFVWVSEHNTLLATSADGRLSVFDIRKKKPVKVSDFQDDELLSLTLVKNGQKAITGSENGVLSIYSWGDWGDCSDRIPGHPGSIEAIAKLSESKIATGCSDGHVRIVSIFPNKIISVLHDHPDDLPIERLRLSPDESFLISCSHEPVIRFWVPPGLEDNGSDNGSESADDESDTIDDDETSEELGQEERIDINATGSLRDGISNKRRAEWGELESNGDTDDRRKQKKEQQKPKPKAKEKKVQTRSGNSNQNAFFADLD